MNNKNCGIVILNYNDARNTIDCVKRNSKINAFSKIIVVDNCSTDDSVELFHKEIEDLCEIIISKDNLGYAYGNNIGIRHLLENKEIDLIFISNPDVWIDKETVEKIILSFNKHEAFGILTGVMFNQDGNVHPLPFWNERTYFLDLIDCFLLTRRIMHKIPRHRINYGLEVMPVFAVPGSFFAMRANVFNLIDGLDEHTFLFFEEDILGKKLKSLNISVGIIPSIKYLHKHSVTVNKVLNAHKKKAVYSKSKLYYQKAYQKIGKFRYGLLWLACKYDVFETLIISYIMLLFRRRR